jgi:hypothetical protein
MSDPVTTQSNPAEYNPHNPAPYTPPQVTPAPEITAPPPSPLASPQQNTDRPPVFGGGKMGTMGSIAYMGDAILRGAMQGRERAQQMKVIKAKRLMDGFVYSKSQADAQVMDEIQKPDVQAALHKRESKAQLTAEETKSLATYDQAVSASDSLWQGINQLQYNYLFGDQKGKGKGKGPETKLQGLFLVRQKLGNPVQYQVRDLLSKVQQQQPALEHQNTLSRLQAQFDSLNAIPEDKLTPEQQSQKADVRRQIDAQKEVAAPYGKNLDKKISSYTGTDNKQHTTWQRPDGSKYESTSEGSVRESVSMSKPKQAWMKDASGKLYSVNLDPKTNQAIPGTENYSLAVPNNIQPETIKTGEFTFIDEFGVVHRPKTTTVTTHGGAGAGARVSAGGAAGAGTDAGRVVGQTLSADDKKVHSALIQTAEKARVLSGLLTTNENYVNAVHADPSKASPRQDLALVIAAVRSMNPGSVRLPQKELDLEIKAGSFGDRFRRSFDNASTGLLPDDQRDDLFGIVKKETTNFGADVAKDWKTNFPDRPLPAHLKRYDTGGGGEGGSGAGGSSGPKTTTMSVVRAYAAKKHITEEAAIQHATDTGYTISDRPK